MATRASHSRDGGYDAPEHIVADLRTLEEALRAAGAPRSPMPTWRRLPRKGEDAVPTNQNEAALR